MLFDQQPACDSNEFDTKPIQTITCGARSRAHIHANAIFVQLIKCVSSLGHA